ncbi:MAG: YdcF family protein [Candidatus Peribacteraceae bacterium]|nr:YdcF family protein [Candidatus Peribacteraceae bacterium]
MTSLALSKRLVIVLMAFLLACAVLAANLFLWFGLTVLVARSGSAVLPAECGIVFGAAVRFDGTAGPSSLRRVQTAAKLYGEGQLERIFITGGRGEGMRFSEAEVMSSVALEEGVDPAAIVLEEQSRSTWENLLFVKPLLENCSSTVAISDGYHLARIRLLAHRQGWGTLQTYPADLRPPLRDELKNLVREVLGLGYYTFF